MIEFSEKDVPSLHEVRSSAASLITQIVEFFQGGRKSAHIDEIVDAIRISNAAEKQSVYSAIDPYTEGAGNRDAEKPLLFLRPEPAIYEFLGYPDDPLDLTINISFKDATLSEAWQLFLGDVKSSKQQDKLRGLSTSGKISVFYKNLSRLGLLDRVRQHKKALEDLKKLP